MSRSLSALLLMFLVGGEVLWAQAPPPDPLGENLFPPELVIQFQAQLGLSNDQRQAIMADIEKAQPRLEKLQHQVQEELAALALLLEKEQVDLERALAQSDKVQAPERELKRAQMALMITIKNRLTRVQQARLQQFKGQHRPDGGSGGNLPPEIMEKVWQLRAGLRRWEKNGLDASSIMQAVEKFEPLIRAGQFKEAEAVLEEALKLLEEKTPR